MLIEVQLLKFMNNLKLKVLLIHRSVTEIEFYKPQGGFYLWCKFPNSIDLNLLLKKSIKNKVNYIPGNFFYAKNKEKSNFIRLNFTYPKKEEIVIGIKRLKNSLNEII